MAQNDSGYTSNEIADSIENSQAHQFQFSLDTFNYDELILSVYMLTITCRDVGQNCDCVIQGETEEELIKNAAEHAVKDHGYTEEDIMTPEMKEKIKSQIHKS